MRPSRFLAFFAALAILATSSLSSGVLAAVPSDTAAVPNDQLVATDTGVLNATTTTSQVFTSGAHVDTWDPILPAAADPTWETTTCVTVPAVGLNANWVNPHRAFDFGTQAHPWQQEGPWNWSTWSHDPPLAGFSANWINAWDNVTSVGPGGQNWTKYSTSVSGTGSFVLNLLADNCSWIYLDGVLVGFQGSDISQTRTYPVQLNGTHNLSFVIFDGGGAAGGMFRLETNLTTVFPTTTTVSFGSGPFVAKGSAFTATATVFVGSVAQSVVAPITYSGDCVNPGNTCTATATFAGDATRGPSSGSASITIAARPPTLAVAAGGGNAAYYVDWTSANPAAGTAAGVITMPGGSQVTLSFTARGPNGAASTYYFGQTGCTWGTPNYWVPSAPYISAEVPNAPPACEMLALTGGTDTVYRVELSQPIRDPIMSIISLGRSTVPTTYHFDSPFTILSQGQGYHGGGANDLRQLPGNVLQGTEGHGTIKFLGTYRTFSWSVPTPEYWHGFTFAIRTTDAFDIAPNEGQTATSHGTWAHPDGLPVTLSASVGTVTKNLDGTWAWSLQTTDGPAQSQTVTVTATDSAGGSTSRSFPLAVKNLPPTARLANNGPVNVGVPATISFSNQADPSSADLASLRYAFSCTGASLDSSTYAASSAGSSTTCTFTNAGNATVRARVIDKDGGFSEYTTVVTVTALATTTTTVSFGDGPFVYKGSPFTATAKVFVGSVAQNVVANVTYSGDCTNAGSTCTATATYAGDATRRSSTATASITIEKAPSTTTVTFPAGPYVYNGSAFSATASVGPSGTATAMPTGTPTIAYTDCTNAGTCTATATYLGDANHLGSSATASITIEKAHSSTTVSFGGGPFVYNGSAFEATASVGPSGTATAMPTGTPTIAYTGDCTNAGSSCTAIATYAGDVNHHGSGNTENITIDKAPTSTAVTFGTGPFIYTGSAFTATATVTPSGTATIDYTGDCVNGGITCTATAIFAGDHNYLASTATAKIAITYKLCPGSGGYPHPRHSGSTIPVKIAVCSATDQNVGSAALKVKAIKISPSGNLDDSGKANPGNFFRFTGDGTYIFNLSTKTIPTGSYTLDFTVGADPTVYRYTFRIR